MPSYYEDAESGGNPGPAAKPEEDAGDSQTAEIPKGVLGGKEFKPGEEVVLQIVQVNEDSVIVKYASTEEKEPEQAPAPEPEMAGAPGGGGMASMME